MIAPSLFAAPANVQTSEASVREASVQFYKAVQATFAGDVEPLKEVWSHADDVTYLGPDGRFQTGWNQVLADWQEQTSLRLGDQVEPSEVVINVGNDIAVCLSWVKGDNRATLEYPADRRERPGGGVSCESASAVVTNCVLTGNAADGGGGIIKGVLNHCIVCFNTSPDQATFSCVTGGAASPSVLRPLRLSKLSPC